MKIPESQLPQALLAKFQHHAGRPRACCGYNAPFLRRNWLFNFRREEFSWSSCHVIIWRPIKCWFWLANWSMWLLSRCQKIEGLSWIVPPVGDFLSVSLADRWSASTSVRSGPTPYWSPTTGSCLRRRSRTCSRTFSLYRETQHSASSTIWSRGRD